MAKDKYTAVWVSHSSISDFLECPRAYYLKNIYKDSQTGHKIKLINPPLALGQVVHEVIEGLSVLPVDKRLDKSLIERLEEIWPKISGKKGGFINDQVENQYKTRAKAMLKKVMDNPGPILNKAVKLKAELPYFWLSSDDNIILCGKIDWLEYLEDSDSVHIIDFKTGKNEEDGQSLQLPIYYLLADSCQSRDVAKASYWYLDHADAPVAQQLPDLDKAYEQILKIAKDIKLARQLERFKCPQKTGCRACRPYEAVLRGEAELVGSDSYGADVYMLNRAINDDGDQSVIL
jgi:ATP-dependent helicase/DNAse subunit B